MEGVTQYKELFLQESREQLEMIDRSLSMLDEDGVEESQIDSIFRCFHTLKGMAASMGYEELGIYCHTLEDLLDQVKKRGGEIDSDVEAIILKGRDMIEENLRAIDEGRDIDLDIDSLKREIEGLKPQKDQTPQIKRGRAKKGRGKEAPSQGITEIKMPQMVKVEPRTLDLLLNMLGELTTSKLRLAELARNENIYALSEETHYIDGLLKELNNLLLRIRLLHFKEIIFGLKRLVKDYSKDKDKDIEFIVEGGDVELDRVVMERVLEALIHVIRNAIDHGIETRKERKAIGKPEKGLLKLTLTKEKGEVIIEVSDDGRGIDPREIKRRAIKGGLITEEEAKALSRQEVFLLTCRPGFSLAGDVTKTSGRGVGMDAVGRAVYGLGGRLSIESRLGKGTRLSLKIPVMTAIMEILYFTLSGINLALPINKVKEVVDWRMAKRSDEGDYLLLNGNKIPIIDLRGLLGIPASNKGDDSTGVVFDAGDSIAAMAVDEVSGEMEAYIKDLAPPLNRLRGISGYTFIRGETPVFIIEPLSLLRDSHKALS